MTTRSEQITADFRALFANATRRVRHGPGGVHELELKLAGPPLRARSLLLSSGSLLFVRGENQAHSDLLLQHEGAAPLVALHTPLRGSAAPTTAGLALTEQIGAVQLFAAPDSCTTVRLRARVKNEAFRISIAPALIEALAARHPQLESLAADVAAKRPYNRTPIATFSPQALLADIDEIMNSDHYGALRPLFLESRALGWLARALAEPEETPAPSLRRREVERMQQARELLLTRFADPPSLAELAAAVGTNEFALKRNFKAVFGQPVYTYLLALRLAHACDLLRDTSRRVK
jgi:hypothetical protein